MSTFRTIVSTHQYRGFSSVRVDVVEGPAGQFSREVVEHPDAVAIVALDAHRQVAMVRQYRHPLAAELLEIPAGTLDVVGEAPEAAARRELAEEVGLRTDTLVPLGTIWNSAGWSDERTHLYLARDTAPAQPPDDYEARDEEAVMTVLWRPLDDVVREALVGHVADAKTAIGVLRAHAALGSDDERWGSTDDAAR